MQQQWDDASLVADSYVWQPVVQPPAQHVAAKRASIGGLLASGVAIATLTKIGAALRMAHAGDCASWGRGAPPPRTDAHTLPTSPSPTLPACTHHAPVMQRTNQSQLAATAWPTPSRSPGFLCLSCS